MRIGARSGLRKEIDISSWITGHPTMRTPDWEGCQPDTLNGTSEIIH